MVSSLLTKRIVDVSQCAMDIGNECPARNVQPVKRFLVRFPSVGCAASGCSLGHRSSVVGGCGSPLLLLPAPRQALKPRALPTLAPQLVLLLRRCGSSLAPLPRCGALGQVVPARGLTASVLWQGARCIRKAHPLPTLRGSPAVFPRGCTLRPRAPLSISRALVGASLAFPSEGCKPSKATRTSPAGFVCRWSLLWSLRCIPRAGAGRAPCCWSLHSIS